MWVAFDLHLDFIILMIIIFLLSLYLLLTLVFISISIVISINISSFRKQLGGAGDLVSKVICRVIIGVTAF